MKKLILIGVLLSGLVFWSPARAITPTTATIDCSAPFGTPQGPFNFSGQVGESFTLVNSGASQCTLAQMAGVVTPSGAGYRVGAFGPEIINGGTATFTIVAAGTFTATTVLGTGDVVTINVTLGGGSGGGPATVVKASFDPNGGECIFDGTKSSSKYNSFTIGFSYAPGNDECARPQCVHVGWNVSSSASTPVPGNLPLLKVDGVQAKRSFVAKSGDFVADWVQAPKFNDVTLSTNTFTGLTWDSGCRGLVQFDASGPCFVNGSSSVKVSGRVTISTRDQGGSCGVTVTPVFTAYQNLDGTLPVSTSASTLPSSTFNVKVEAPPPPRSIVITGERTTVSGKPGICVYGQTTGFADADTVVPYVRFPGGDYTIGSARPVVGVDGSFEWCRKTGKKTYVYFTDLDGAVTSNRVIIAAN